MVNFSGGEKGNGRSNSNLAKPRPSYSVHRPFCPLALLLGGCSLNRPSPLCGVPFFYPGHRTKWEESSPLETTCPNRLLPMRGSFLCVEVVVSAGWSQGTRHTQSQVPIPGPMPDMQVNSLCRSKPSTDLVCFHVVWPQNPGLVSPGR